MNDDELRSAFQDLLHDLPGDRPLPAATVRRASRRRTLKLGAGALGGAGAIAVAAALVLGVATPSQDRLVIPADPPTVAPSAAASTSPPPAASPAPSPVAVPDAAPLPSTGATAGSPVQAAPSPQPPARPRVILRPDGLGFTDGGSSTSFLPFGTDATTVRGAVDRALLEGQETQTPDCGAGSSVVQHENLFLRLQNGRFVGWTTGSPGLTTGDGIGIGTTLLELREALPGVVVSEGTLGPEWSVESGLAGFLDGTADTSVVNSMGAGDRCLAR